MAPRPVQATSIPGMLQLFQAEWDTLTLECYKLKQQLEQTRQELSHARSVIAERDAELQATRSSRVTKKLNK